MYMELKNQLLLYLIGFLLIMFVIGITTGFLINFILYIGVFYLASELLLKNSQLQILAFSALLIYGIYILIQFSQNESYLDYYTFKTNLYDDFINTIINKARFNPNSMYVLSFDPDSTTYNSANDLRHAYKIK